MTNNIVPSKPYEFQTNTELEDCPQAFQQANDKGCGFKGRVLKKLTKDTVKQEMPPTASRLSMLTLLPDCEILERCMCQLGF